MASYIEIFPKQNVAAPYNDIFISNGDLSSLTDWTQDGTYWMHNGTDLVASSTGFLTYIYQPITNIPQNTYYDVTINGTVSNGDIYVGFSGGSFSDAITGTFSQTVTLSSGEFSAQVGAPLVLSAAPTNTSFAATITSIAAARNEAISPAPTREEFPFSGSVILPLAEDVEIVQKYQADSLRDIAAKQHNHSLTIKIPATDEVKRALGYLNDNASSFEQFNPNNKAKASLYEDNVEIETGFLQVMRYVSKDHVGKNVDGFFECRLFSDTINVFNRFEDMRMCDLNWSQYDHILNYTNITTSWLNDYTKGYTYPLYKKEFTQTDEVWNQVNNYSVDEDFLPAPFLKTALEMGFADIGYNLVLSDEVDLILSGVYLQYSGKRPTSSDELTNSASFQVAANANVDVIQSNGNTYQFQPVDFVSDAQYNSGAFNFTTDIFSSTQTVDYEFSYDFSFTLEHAFDPTFLPVTYSTSIPNTRVDVIVQTKPSSSSEWFGSDVLSSDSTDPAILTVDSEITFNALPVTRTYSFNMQRFNVPLTVPIGYDVRVVVQLYDQTVYARPSMVGSPLNFNEEPATKLTLNSGNLNFVANATELREGNYIEMKQIVPRTSMANIMRSLQRTYNWLYDVQGNTVFIRSRKEFYNQAETIDITHLVDGNREATTTFLSDIQGEAIELGYNKSTQRGTFAEDYETRFDQIYGNALIQLGNDFYLDRQEILAKEFLPTPISHVATPSGKIYVPDIRIDDKTSKLRPLLFVPRSNTNHEFTTTTLPVKRYNEVIQAYEVIEVTEMPLNVHVDSISAPTIDLNFDVVQETDMGGSQLNLTNGNMYNRFWRGTIEQIRTGKQLKVYVDLAPYLIERLKNKLHTKIEIDGVTYIIDQISHSPNKRAMSELILNEFPLNTEGDVEIVYSQVPSGVGDYNPLNNQRPPNYQDVIIIGNQREDNPPVVVDEDTAVVMKFADILTDGSIRPKKHFGVATELKQNIISGATQTYDPKFPKPIFKVGVDYSLYHKNPTPFTADYSGQVTGETISREWDGYWFAVAGQPQSGRTLSSESSSGSTVRVFPPRQANDPTSRESF